MGANTTNTDNRIYRELCQLTKNKTAWNEKIPYVASLLENSTPKIVAKAMWMLGEMGLLNPQAIAGYTANGARVHMDKMCALALFCKWIYAFASVQLWLSVWSCTMWAKIPPSCSSCAGDPCSATAPSLSTTILSAPATVRIRWAIMRTVLFLMSRDNAS